MPRQKMSQLKGTQKICVYPEEEKREHKLLPLIWTSVMLMGLSGCANVSGPDVSGEEPREVDSRVPEQQSSESASELTSLPDLMLRRRQLCALSMEDRLHLLSVYRGFFVEADSEVVLPDTQPEREHLLNALILSSCSPARTPGILGEMLVVVDHYNDWPAYYQEYFNVLSAHYRAYTLLDDQTRDLNRELQRLQARLERLREEHRALEAEHEKTIQGISEIERGFD